MNGGDSGEVCGSKEEVKKDYDNGKDDAMEVDSDRMGTESEDKVSHIDHDQGRNPSENGDLLTKENGGNNATDNNLSVGDETLDDLKVDTNVDGLQGESKGMELESEVNNDKSHDSPVNGQTVVDSNVAKSDNDASVANGGAKSDNDASVSGSDNDGSNGVRLSEVKAGNEEKRVGSDDGAADMDLSPTRSEVKESKSEVDLGSEVGTKNPNLKFLYEPPVAEGDELGTEEEQAAFAKEVENFYKEKGIEFKHPKFYKEDVNLLKLWRAVIRLGGYDEVTSNKLWRQVGESFNPPKTCTTVSWTFRIFYEKALLEYERHRIPEAGHPSRDGSVREPDRISNQASGSQAQGTGRTPRDAAARARQGWHSKRFLESGEVCQPIIKEKSSTSTPKSDKQIRNMGLLKRKRPSTADRTFHVAHAKATNQLDAMVIDIGPPADWVKINVQKTCDCYEVYALVPGLLREEVHVQSDPAGRLVISGKPEQPDNPWGVRPFKKVVSLPSRIDPHHTSAVVTLHGQLFVRVPIEQSDA